MALSPTNDAALLQEVDEAVRKDQLDTIMQRYGRWILGGAVAVEYVFARPGLGSLLITGLGQRDYPLVQGCLLMLAIAVMLGTLIGDLAQAALDPRLREAMGAR